MTKEIVFSHQYEKLFGIRNGEDAILCDAYRLAIKDMSLALKHWDTLYYENGEEKHYAFPTTGDLLALLFFSPAAKKFFPTYRSYTAVKHEYYAKLVNAHFKVVIQ